jgi:hypothetical protein
MLRNSELYLVDLKSILHREVLDRRYSACRRNYNETIWVYLVIDSCRICKGSKMRKSFPPPICLPRFSITVNRRRYDIDNERLPNYEPPSTALESTFPAPSMRQTSITRSGSPVHFLTKAYEEDEQDEAILSLADRVARMRRRSSTGGGARVYDQLKRHDTV